MKIVLSILLGVLSFQTCGWPAPMPSKVKKIKDHQLAVYPDSENPDLFWFVPLVKPLVKDGKLIYTKRPAADGKVSFVFAVVPYMPKENLRLIAESIPELHSLDQLQPVIAKRLGIQIEDPVNVSALNEKATDIKYLDYSQKFRLNLSATEAEALEDDLKSGFGLRANVIMAFDSERVTKTLNIELKYEDVYKALGIGVGGSMLFTRAMIEGGISNYLGKKYMSVTGKGNLDIPSVVQQVILTFFRAYTRPNQNCNGNGNNNGGYYPGYPGGVNYSNPLKLESFAVNAENPKPAKSPNPAPSVTPSPSATPAQPDTPWEPDPSPVPTPTPSYDPNQPFPNPSQTGYPNDPYNPGGYPGGYPGSGYGNGSGGGNCLGSVNGGLTPTALFEFRADMQKNKDSFIYHQVQTADAEEVVVLPVDLAIQSEATKTASFSKIAEKSLEVRATASSDKPIKSGIILGSGDKLFLDTSFTLSVSNANGSQLDYPAWDSSWARPEEDLYYRIGNSPWIRMGKRVVIEPSSPYLGELEFYLDRSAIFNKIPEDLRKGKFIFPAKFLYERTLPVFHVTVSGAHYSDPSFLYHAN